MKKWIPWMLVTLVLLGAGLWAAKETAETAARKRLLAQMQPAASTQPATEYVPPETTAPPETLPPVQESTQPPVEITQPYVLDFTSEEEDLLLKLAMAERGETGCTECIALVMRTVLNRVEAPKFSSSIRGVIYAQDQFTPVSDGSLEAAVPNEACREALEQIRRGWDESQGALYYEWCEGESWHSQNLTLLFQHCDTRFYQ